MMLARYSLLVLFLTVATSQFVSAQTENKAAQKVDEFGDILITDITARLDFFAVQLQNAPLSKGFIMVYRSRRDLPGLSYRYAHRMAAYLVSSRGLEKERVIAVDGGEADCLRQELWIVPLGTAPTTRSDAYPRHFLDTDSARKFDEFTWGGDDAPRVYAEGLEAYAAALRAEPKARAYLIAYSGYYRQQEQWEENGKSRQRVQTYSDPPNTSRKVLSEARRLLTRTYRLSPTRIRLMDGGHRKLGGLELWIVPAGEHAPIATPNSFPSRRQIRAK
jgi:hypothetical protein